MHGTERVTGKSSLSIEAVTAKRPLAALHIPKRTAHNASSASVKFVSTDPGASLQSCSPVFFSLSFSRCTTWTSAESANANQELGHEEKLPPTVS